MHAHMQDFCGRHFMLTLHSSRRRQAHVHIHIHIIQAACTHTVAQSRVYGEHEQQYLCEMRNAPILKGQHTCTHTNKASTQLQYDHAAASICVPSGYRLMSRVRHDPFNYNELQNLRHASNKGPALAQASALCIVFGATVTGQQGLAKELCGTVTCNVWATSKEGNSPGASGNNSGQL